MNLRRFAPWAALVAAAATLALFVFARAPAGDESAEALDDAIHKTAAHLHAAMRPDGSFVYRVNVNPAVRVTPKYNMLRHAGTVYALALYRQRFSERGDRDALLASVRFLKSQIAPLPEDPRLAAVWSDPRVNGAKAPMQAKLGGSGLTLVALTSVEKVAPGTTSVEELRALARFVLFMQKEDGSFYSKYVPVLGGRDDSFTSLYYPGEAALGLLLLEELDPDPRWRAGALKALLYLARSREGQRKVPADHWAMMATAQLFARDSDDVGEHRELLLAHAHQVARELMRKGRPLSDELALQGATTRDGRTTPTSTRMEGLLALLEAKLLEGELRTRAEARVREAMEFLLRAQIASGPFAGAFMRNAQVSTAILQRLPTADSKRATEIRIDYGQHALCAMMMYRELTRHDRR